MRINGEDKIDGIRLINIRNVLRKMIYLQLNRSEIELLLSSSLRNHSVNTLHLIDSLIRLDYLEIVEGKYCLAQKGRRLCSARSLKPLTKEKVEQIIEDFLERIEEVKKNKEFLYEVRRILLFGSCLNPEARDFGDIDFAYELKAKIHDQIKLNELRQKQIEQVKDNGRVFRNIVEEVCYPKDKVLRYLKNRNRYISLHTVDEVKILGCEYKEIYLASEHPFS